MPLFFGEMFRPLEILLQVHAEKMNGWVKFSAVFWFNYCE